MDKNKVEIFKGKLEKEKKRLEGELKKIHDENLDTATAQQEFGGDQNYEDHMGDAASNVFDRERDLSLEQNLQDLLAQVNEALRRIETDKFGWCTRCGRKINDARLRAIPYTELCIDCKKAEELTP